MNAKPQLFVVIGDVHADIALAVDSLERLESELNRPISQIFSVGDFGLFLEEADWKWLSGPKHHRHPERTPVIREAWSRWRWRLACIGGNHEPFHKLREFSPEAFGHKLTYTNAGELAHGLPGLRVIGLSGIYHADHLRFVSEQDARSRSAPKPNNWSEMVALARLGQLSLRRLTYFKQEELDLVAALEARPHLLLTHDWPTWPRSAAVLHEDRPERAVLEALMPEFHCCGHWHFADAFTVGETQVRALNILSVRPNQIESGWASCFEWDGARLVEIGRFPS
ncbi:MAG: hypothetical protein JSR82_05720 [Verrucomicrobia bacterium]|nr:hypothetical protein [Verrucomicrobiota bacterium]